MADESRALLVGVTKYDCLAEDRQLIGPRNDVREWRRLLEETFQFKPENITELVESNDLNQRPTRDHIEHAFRTLAQQSKAGDFVFIIMSGHGTMVPSTDPPEVEPDGMDQAFLPADVGPWEKDEHVLNEIRDNDFGEWLTQITKTGANVWIIFDACCSGSMTRGGSGGERTRFVDPERDLKIPYDTIRKAREHAAASRKTNSRGANDRYRGFVTPADVNPRLVAFFAAWRDEETIELPFPDSASEKPDHSNCFGIFSYNLISVLKQSANTLTYGELMQRVMARHQAIHSDHRPTPGSAGALDQQVLGQQIWPQRSRIRLARSTSGQLRLNSGSLLGLTVGSILSVHSPAGRSDSKLPLGHVRLTAIQPTTAIAVPCDAEGQDAPMFNWVDPPPDAPGVAVELPCEIVRQNFGDFRLRLGVARRAVETSQISIPSFELLAPAQRSPVLQSALERLTDADQGGRVVITDDLQSCQWIIECDDRRVFLRRKKEVEPVDGRIGRSSKDMVFGPFEASSATELSSKLLDSAAKIYRWQNLVALAGSGGPALSGNSHVLVDVRLRRCKSEEDLTGEPWDGRDYVVGNFFNISLQNNGDKAVRISAIFLQEDYSVTVLPSIAQPAIDLPAGNSEKTFALLRPRSIRVDGANNLLEHCIVIAQPIEPQQNLDDFHFLEQDPLRISRGNGVISPLAQLFDIAAFGARGGPRGKPETAQNVNPNSCPVVKLLSWRSIAAPPKDPVTSSPAPR